MGCCPIFFASASWVCRGDLLGVVGVGVRVRLCWCQSPLFCLSVFWGKCKSVRCSCVLIEMPVGALRMRGRVWGCWVVSWCGGVCPGRAGLLGKPVAVTTTLGTQVLYFTSF